GGRHATTVPGIIVLIRLCASSAAVSANDVNVAPTPGVGAKLPVSGMCEVYHAARSRRLTRRRDTVRHALLANHTIRGAPRDRHHHGVRKPTSRSCGGD